MSYELRILVLVLPLVVACSTTSSPPARPAQEHHLSRGDETVRKAIERFEKWREADYKLYNMPTLPPPSPVRPIPEYERSGALMLVYDHRVPIKELIEGAIDIVPVVLLVRRDSAYAKLEEAVLSLQELGFGKHLRTGRIQVFVVPTDTFWVRDFGPIFVSHGGDRTSAIDTIYEGNRPLSEPERAPVDFITKVSGATPLRHQDDRLPYFFGSELNIATYRPPLILAGGNFAADGRGKCFTSTETLAQNGGERETISKLFKAYLGCVSVTYLEALPGPTTRHVDMFFRVVDDGHVVLGEYEPRPHPRTAGAYLQAEAHKRMERNFALLQTIYKDAKVEIVRMPMPAIDQVSSEDGQEYTYRTFLNYVHLKGETRSVVLVPSYPVDFSSQALEKQAEQILRRLYPSTDLEFVVSDELIKAQGALHCVTIVLPHRSAGPILGRVAPDDSTGPKAFLARWPNGGTITVGDVRAELRSLAKREDRDFDTFSLRDWKEALDRLVFRRSADSQLALANRSLESEKDRVKAKARGIAGDDDWRRFVPIAKDEVRMELLLEVSPPDPVTRAGIEEYYDRNREEYWEEGSRTLLMVVVPHDHEDGEQRVLASAVSPGVVEWRWRIRRYDCDQPAAVVTEGVSSARAKKVTVSDSALSGLNDDLRETVERTEFLPVSGPFIDEDRDELWFKACSRTRGRYRPLEEVSDEIREHLEVRNRLHAKQRIASELVKRVEIAAMDVIPD